MITPEHETPLSKKEYSVLTALAYAEEELESSELKLFGFNKDVISELSGSFGVSVSEEECLTQLERLETRGLVDLKIRADEALWIVSEIGRKVVDGDIQSGDVRRKSIRDTLGEIPYVSF